MRLEDSIIEKLFDNSCYRNIDTRALVESYDIRAHLDTGPDDLERARGDVHKNDASSTPVTISTLPYTITTEGTYQLASDLTWNSGNAASAITISANNVTLDLAGYSLEPQGPDLTWGTGLYSVLIISGAENVTVKNGKINMPVNAILAKAVTALLIDSITVSGADATTQATKGDWVGGIVVQGDENTGDFCSVVTINDCAISNVNVTVPAYAAILCTSAINLSITGCSADNFTKNGGSGQGFSFCLCQTITCNNNTVTNLTTTVSGNGQGTAYTSIGFMPVMSVDFTSTQCSATNIVGCEDDCHGMSLFITAGCSVSNFTADGIHDAVTPSNTGAKTTSLEVYGRDIPDHRLHC